MAKTAKDFLLNMDKIHEATTRTVPDARPPKFQYKWKDDKTLIMIYNSQRNLMPFLLGLIKGVGKYYNTNLQVNQLSSKEVEIKFP